MNRAAPLDRTTHLDIIDPMTDTINDTRNDRERPMPIRTTIENYFDALARRSSWQDHLADGLRFTSYAAPGKQVTGREAYVESTKGFYSMIEGLELRQLIIDGDRACAQTRYALQPPRGERFTCDVAEVFTVRDGRIESLEIYFDSALFAR